MLSYIPAKIKFISAEPLLESIDFGLLLEDYDWVITGCESGAKEKRRPMDLDWVRDIDRQCKEYGVPHFFKQRYVGNELIYNGFLDGVLVQEYPILGMDKKTVRYLHKTTEVGRLTRSDNFFCGRKGDKFYRAFCDEDDPWVGVVGPDKKWSKARACYTLEQVKEALGDD
jgi:hypothetical protein